MNSMSVKTVLVMRYHLFFLNSTEPRTGKPSGGEQENIGENCDKRICSHGKLTTDHGEFPLTCFYLLFLGQYIPVYHENLFFFLMPSM